MASLAGGDEGHARQIAEILDGFGDAFIAYDFDWRVIYCNRAAEAHFGIRREDATGKPIWDLVPVDADSPLRRFLETSMAERRPAEADFASEVHPGRWVNLRAFPLETGLGVSAHDITERRERQRREREQAERLEIALATSGFGEWSWDAASDLVELSERAAAAFGLTGDEVVTWSRLLKRLHTEDREATRAAGRAAMEQHGLYEVTFRLTHPVDRTERWLMIRARGVYGEAGEVRGLRGVLADITKVKAEEAQVRADRARLAELERRAAHLLEIADALRLLDDPDEILRTAVGMTGAWLNSPRVGYAEFDDDDAIQVRSEWVRPGLSSRTGQALAPSLFGPQVMELLRRGDAVSVADVRLDPRTAPYAESYEQLGARALLVAPLVRNGRLDAAFCTAESVPRTWSGDDLALVDEVASRTWAALTRARIERQAAERQRLLINELNHRVKNTLATIQSLVHQTLREGVITHEARDRLTDRLLALSTAHNVLTRENWQSADLAEIAVQALAPYDEPAGERIVLSGPSARLAPHVALALSMALHELTTNAVKYGALSVASGRVTVDWALNPDGRVATLEWRESGGPHVSPPRTKGFGSRLIAGLAAEFGAPAKVLYEPRGLICRLSVPVT